MVHVFEYAGKKAVLLTSYDIVQPASVLQQLIDEWKQAGITYLFIITSLPQDQLHKKLREIVKRIPQNCFWGELKK